MIRALILLVLVYAVVSASDASSHPGGKHCHPDNQECHGGKR